jgi:hypothetical protein
MIEDFVKFAFVKKEHALFKCVPQLLLPSFISQKTFEAITAHLTQLIEKEQIDVQINWGEKYNKVKDVKADPKDEKVKLEGQKQEGN